MAGYLRIVPTDVTVQGERIEDVGDEVVERTESARRLRFYMAEGLQTAPAFESFRDGWLNVGSGAGEDVTDAGQGTETAGENHAANETAQTTRYQVF